MSPELETLAQQGLLGILLVAALAWIKRLQDRCEQLQAQRVEDARAYGERALAISERVHETVRHVRELLEAMGERDRD